MTEVTVHVRNIAVGGSGVGEVQGQSDGNSDMLGITAFVPFSAVGEVVRARVVKREKRYVNTELVEIQSSALDRITPPCPYYRICGGCELQHIEYSGQLNAKRELVISALRAARLPLEVIDSVQPFVRSSPYHYRRRVTLHVDSSGKVGFYRESSRSVVQIQSCDVAIPSIAELLPALQDLGRVVQGKISSILLEADNQGVVAVLKAPYDLTADTQRSILEEARKHFQNVTLMVGEKEVGGFGRQILELPLGESGRFTLKIPAGSFSQVNWDVNNQLVAKVVELSGATNGKLLYDLYAGAGNFTLPLARAGARVHAVESDKRLVVYGRENAARYGLEKNIEYFDSSVEKFLARMELPKNVDAVVADPPRSGLGKLVPFMGFTNRLLFISCHLPSFVRDVKACVEEGWRVRTIIPFDMFAQTSYVEILGLLER